MLPETAKTVARRLGPASGAGRTVRPGREHPDRHGFFSGNVWPEAAICRRPWPATNAGENRVALWQRTLAPLGDELFIELIPYTETRDYVRRILANAMMYGRLYAGSER